MKSIPAPVWRLTIAYSLMMAGTSLMVLIAGIIGLNFAPTPGLATLPIALVVVGVAVSTLPTGKALHLWGRRRVFIAWGLLAICAGLMASWSLVIDNFGIFCAAALLLGWSAAAGHQYRFAALESVPPHLAPRATSFLLVGGILAAFVGPEIAVRGRAMLVTEYAGSFLLLCAGYAIGLVIVSFNRDVEITGTESFGVGRPLREILRSRHIVLAICAAALGYGVMSFLMTATPISMHGHAGHSLDATKFVIQSHIAAMYLPSLAYPWLQERLGFLGMLRTGVLVLAICVAIALISSDFLHYWLALVLLGVGWNFLFLSGTNMLPLGYRPEERFRVQSFNDFLVFSIQALASLSSGWFLFRWGWNGLLWACIPLLLAFGLLLLRNRTLMH